MNVELDKFAEDLQPKVLDTYFNSENEKLTIEVVQSGDFKGKLLLIIHDNEGSGLEAPMLFDKGTRSWLRDKIAAIDKDKS